MFMVSTESTLSLQDSVGDNDEIRFAFRVGFLSVVRVQNDITSPCAIRQE